MKKSWQIEVDAKTYNIEFNNNSFSNSNKLLINDNAHSLNSMSKFFPLIDYEFKIQDEKFNFICVGNECNLAQNGYFLDTQKPYSKLNVPKKVSSSILFFYISSTISFGIIGIIVALLISKFLITKIVIEENTKIIPILFVISIILLIMGIWGYILTFILL